LSLAELILFRIPYTAMASAVAASMIDIPCYEVVPLIPRFLGYWFRYNTWFLCLDGG